MEKQPVYVYVWRQSTSDDVPVVTVKFVGPHHESHESLSVREAEKLYEQLGLALRISTTMSKEE